MAKVQSDFYFRWAQDRIQATYIADQELTSLIEYVGVDTTSNIVEIELPDSTGTDVINGKNIWIIDQGNANTNNVTVIPNSADSTTIEGQSSFIMDEDNQIVKFELVDDQWIVIADTATVSRGSFSMHENAAVTTIVTVDTYTDFGGTASANALNNNFSFASNTLTSNVTGNGMLHMDMSVSKALQPFNNMRAAIFKNGSELTDANNFLEINRHSSVLSISFPVDYVPTDTFTVRVKNINHTDNILVSDINYNIIED